MAMTQQQVQLVTAAQNGDQKSFEALYGIYYGKIYALARMILKNESNAEDVLQDTFITAWRKLGTLKTPETFSVWLQIIAKNLCNDQLRKKNIAILLDADRDIEDFDAEDTEELLPAIYTERADLKERLGRIIERLSDVQRQAIVLYYYSGLSVEEISDVMECGVNTVKTRLYLARRTIRAEIEEEERKSGERFFGIIGVPMLPFGRLIAAQMESLVPSASFGTIANSIAKTTGKAVKTVSKATKAIIAIAAVAVVGVAAFIAIKAIGGKPESPTNPVATSEATTVTNPPAREPEVSNPELTPYDMTAELLEPDGNFITPGSVRLTFSVTGLEEQPLLDAMTIQVERKIGGSEWEAGSLHQCPQMIEESKIAEGVYAVIDTWGGETPWSEDLLVSYRLALCWDDLDAGVLGLRSGYSNLITLGKPGHISLDKAVYAPGETIRVETSGITEQMAAEKAFVSVYEAGASSMAWLGFAYPKAGEDLLEIAAPAQEGSYVMRLYSKDADYSDETFVMQKSFTVAE